MVDITVTRQNLTRITLFLFLDYFYDPANFYTSLQSSFSVGGEKHIKILYVSFCFSWVHSDIPFSVFFLYCVIVSPIDIYLFLSYFLNLSPPSICFLLLGILLLRSSYLPSCVHYFMTKSSHLSCIPRISPQCLLVIF